MSVDIKGKSFRICMQIISPPHKKPHCHVLEFDRLLTLPSPNTGIGVIILFDRRILLEEETAFQLKVSMVELWNMAGVVGGTTNNINDLEVVMM